MKEEIIKEINAMLLYNNIDYISENEIAILSNKILNIVNGEKKEEIELLKRKVRKAKRRSNDDDLYDSATWMW